MSEHWRILQILPDLTVGGAERMVVDLVAHLIRSGLEVAVVSMYDSAQTNLAAELEAVGAPVFYLGKRLGFDPRQFGRIGRVLKRFRPHLVHTHRYALSYAWPSLHRQHLPCVHTVHSLAEREVRPLHQFIFRKAYRGGVVPVAISKEVADSLARVYGLTNLPLILNGIEVQKYRQDKTVRFSWRRQNQVSTESVVCVAVGRLVPAKNHALLLRAFREVADAVPAAQLLIAGDGMLRRELEELSRALGLTGRVRLLGERSDIPELLAAADLFVLSSNWEGHPLSVMEALSAGLPVVATAVGGVPEQVDEGVTGLLVPPDDCPALSQALLRLLNDSALRTEMGQHAQQQAGDRFSLTAMTHAYIDLYRCLLRTPREA